MLALLLELVFFLCGFWMIYTVFSKAWKNLPLEEKLNEIEELQEDASFVDAHKTKAKDLEKNREKVENFVKK